MSKRPAKPTKPAAGTAEPPKRPARTAGTAGLAAEAAPPARRRVSWRWLSFVLLAIGAFLLPLVVPRDAVEGVLESFAGDAVSRGQSAFSEARAGTAGDPIVWIGFDEDGIQALTGRGPGPETPRDLLAGLLDKIRSQPANRPRLVYLDVALPPQTGTPAENARLAAALARWNGDPRAPPLAIFAGRSCAGPFQPVDAIPATYQTHLFDPGPFRNQVGLASPAARRAGARVIWSCPTYAGLRQAEWSCVHRSDDPQRGPIETFAMPSPAWFAASVRASRTASDATMLANLAHADSICRGLDPQDSPLPRPAFSRVNIPLDGANALAALADRQIGNRALLTRLDMSTLLGPGGETSALRDAMVVISGSDWLPDIAHTESGPVPGSLVVAAALRETSQFGLYEPPSPWADALTALIVFLVLGIVVRILLPGLQREATKAVMRPLQGPVFFATHRQVLMTLILVLLLFAPGLLGADMVIPFALAALLIEALILLDELGKDWKDVGEKL